MSGLRIVLIAALAVVAAAGAYAQQKSAFEPSNPPEPALQVYKTTWRGIQAFFYQTGKSLKQGNDKLPILGSIEVFQGVRRGGVELAGSAYAGMAGSKPKPVRSENFLNNVIDDDPALRNGSDFVSTAVLLNPYAAAGIWTGHKALDRTPMAKEQQQNAVPAVAQTPVRRAQKQYLGQRAEINRKPALEGNLLKLAR